jgi:hypothetical protein
MMRFVIMLAVCVIALAQVQQAQTAFEISRALQIMHLEQKSH